jgi:hypothetical protein
LNTFESFRSLLYDVNEYSFDDIALKLFRFQALENQVYKSYIGYLGVNPAEVLSLKDVPFMPISFFKHHTLKTGAWSSSQAFTSSGTTGLQTSAHAVFDLQFYLRHSEKCFNHFFGDLKQYHFLALLPSYLERQGSSLIAMMDHFISESQSPYSGFYLDNIPALIADLNALSADKSRKTILWGVTFALLDLAENHAPDLSHCLIFETGGMKGRRKEITRKELHQGLSEKFNVSQIFSEYGMTELFSQAYSIDNEIFKPVPWLKITGREMTDPMNKGLLGETSGINVTDLANWHSIAFIETEDLGKVYDDGSFEILGRMDNSDVRGCNLMVE